MISIIIIIKNHRFRHCPYHYDYQYNYQYYFYCCRHYYFYPHYHYLYYHNHYCYPHHYSKKKKKNPVFFPTRPYPKTPAGKWTLATYLQTRRKTVIETICLVSYSFKMFVIYVNYFCGELCVFFKNVLFVLKKKNSILQMTTQG